MGILTWLFGARLDRPGVYRIRNRKTDVAQGERFAVLSNGMYAFRDQASLMYAWDYGLYWSGRQKEAPSAVTKEHTEHFRQMRSGKSCASDTDRTSIESDGYWNK